jgi:hypothetical protein
MREKAKVSTRKTKSSRVQHYSTTTTKVKAKEKTYRPRIKKNPESSISTQLPINKSITDDQDDDQGNVSIETIPEES